MTAKRTAPNQYVLTCSAYDVALFADLMDGCRRSISYTDGEHLARLRDVLRDSEPIVYTNPQNGLMHVGPVPAPETK